MDYVLVIFGYGFGLRTSDLHYLGFIVCTTREEMP